MLFRSTTVRGIVALFQKMGLDIVLAAPTGRAAKRMSELTGGMEAQTIHRLLGMKWDEATHQVTFQKSEQEPLEADAVIVDEMSMVDLTLMNALLCALRPDCRLIMVGDDAITVTDNGDGTITLDGIRKEVVQIEFRIHSYIDNKVIDPNEEHFERATEERVEVVEAEVVETIDTEEATTPNDKM